MGEQYPDLFDDADDTWGGDAGDTSGGDADDTSGDEEKKSSGGDAEKKSSGGKAEKGKSRLRFFDTAVHLPHSPKGGYAVLSCLLGCALAAAVGLAVVLRRRKARASDHDSLINAEDSE